MQARNQIIRTFFFMLEQMRKRICCRNNSYASQNIDDVAVPEPSPGQCNLDLMKSPLNLYRFQKRQPEQTAHLFYNRKFGRSLPSPLTFTG